MSKKRKAYRFLDEDAEANLPRAEKFFSSDDIINWE